MSIDANIDHVPLTGENLAIFVVSIVCGIISAIIVALRSWVRAGEGLFGWDDGLMLSGLIIYIVEVGLACTGATRGLGSHDSALNAYLQVEAKKYLMIWMLLYVCSLVLIKSALCVTMLRIARVNKHYRLTIYLMLAVIIGTWVTTFVGILCLCSPVRANWDTALVLEGKATCASMSAMLGLSYTSTASSIATDMACAVLPGIILWRTQMRLKDKISVSILLSFGSIASISTMIRTPYIAYYKNPSDNLVYHVGNIVLWSNIESAIGLVAGSLPMLRRLVMRNIKSESSSSDPLSGGVNNKPTGLVTIGSMPATKGGRRGRMGGGGGGGGFKNPTDIGVSIATVRGGRDRDGDGDDERGLREESLSDLEESSREGHPGGGGGGIRADYTYEIELSSARSVR